MKAYLIQHAEAKSREEDSQRSLSEVGRKNIQKVSEYMARLNLAISEVWHSEKLRAKQTASILANSLRISDELKEVQGLAPNDDVVPIKDQLMESRENIAIVGHLPFLGKLASLLLCGSEEANVIDFKMGGVVCLNRNDDKNIWTVDWMVVPDIV